MRIALAGNPNSGKTTLFNAITGKIEHVGNWPGVTVSKKEGDVKKELNKSGKKIRVVDLPGAYSLSAFTCEENITRDFVKKEAPDVIINIVDATNLSRSLLFTTQLLELGIPLVVALNKSDLLDNKEITIDTEKLAERLGCPVVETASIEGKGLAELIAAAGASVGKSQSAPFCPAVSPEEETPTPVAAVDRPDLHFFHQGGDKRKAFAVDCRNGRWCFFFWVGRGLERC